MRPVFAKCMISLVLVTMVVVYVKTEPKYSVVSENEIMIMKKHSQFSQWNVFNSVFSPRRAVKIAQKAWDEQYLDENFEKYVPYEIKYDKMAKIWIVRGKHAQPIINDKEITVQLGGIPFAIIDGSSGSIISIGKEK